MTVAAMVEVGRASEPGLRDRRPDGWYDGGKAGRTADGGAGLNVPVQVTRGVCDHAL